MKCSKCSADLEEKREDGTTRWFVQGDGPSPKTFCCAPSCENPAWVPPPRVDFRLGVDVDPFLPAPPFPPDSPYNPDNLEKATPGTLCQLAFAMNHVALERVRALFRGKLVDTVPGEETYPDHCYDPAPPSIEACTLEYVVEDGDEPYVLLTIDCTDSYDRTSEVEALKPQLKAMGVDAVFVMNLHEPIWVD